MNIPQIDTDKLIEELAFCDCADNHITEDFQKVFDCLWEAKGADINVYYTDIATKTGLKKTHVELILFEFDRLDVTEHGSSARYSWLFGEGYKKICI